jgi:hypothetical protein
MKPLSQIYLIKVCLGIVAAALSVLLGFNTLIYGVWFSIVIYLLSYYLIKRLFLNKVEKPSKILTTGIGGYFFVWLVSWVLFFTTAHPELLESLLRLF